MQPKIHVKLCLRSCENWAVVFLFLLQYEFRST